MKKTIAILSLLTVVAITNQSCKKNQGCTNPAACNFDADAKKDDGSCELGKTWYLDADGDGQGNALVSTTACSQPAGYVSNSSDANDIGVVKKQRATITYVGATWCPPCGAYGDPAKIYMEATHGDNVVLLNIQKGDAISTSSEFGPIFGGAFNTAFSNNSIPHAFWSGHGTITNHWGFSSDVNYNNNFYSGKITGINSKTPELSVGAFASKSGNTITVKTKTVFYSAISSPRYIGVYLLEDGIMKLQDISGQPDAITEHNNVLRIAANGSTGVFGTTLIGNSFTANQAVDGSYTITANSSWNASKFQVAVVIWSGTAADKISNSVLVNVY